MDEQQLPVSSSSSSSSDNAGKCSRSRWPRLLLFVFGAGLLLTTGATGGWLSARLAPSPAAAPPSSPKAPAVFALMQLLKPAPAPIFETDWPLDLAGFRRSQAEQVRSRRTLNAAVRRDEIKKLGKSQTELVA